MAGDITSIGKVLVLGGIRSGKSDLAESLLSGVERVRYIATAESSQELADRIDAHRFRRPATWETVEATGDPSLLVNEIAYATGESALLIDDLGGWATALLGRPDGKDFVKQLADAVSSSPAPLI